jgi:osmotically-inducible protein OsmY
MARDQILGYVRRQRRQLEHAARRVGADANGIKARMTHRHERPKDYDDATLARKVETVIFRTADAPKSTVNESAQNGVVALRGEVQTAEQMRSLVDQTRRVQGVQSVENLPHLPGSPARMHSG